MLVEHDLFGNTYDKVADAIKIAQMFEPPDGEGYYLAYSGGKDSVCVKRILDMAGVKYDTHYAVTTVDPPELVRFIISQFDHVIYDMPDETHRYFDVVDGRLTPAKEIPSEKDTIHFRIPNKPMIKLIPHEKMPPTRIARYCCKELKETGGMFRRVVTGVRKAESVNRKENQGMVTIPSKKATKIANEMNVDFTQARQGGVVLNYDNAESRELIDHCVRTSKVMVNPLIDWEDEDVWEFIKRENIPYCKLYDEGLKRLGCIGCPMGNKSQKVWQFNRWPVYRKMYVKAFDEIMKVRKAAGLQSKANWTDGESVMKWWMGDLKAEDKNQMRMDLEEAE